MGAMVSLQPTSPLTPSACLPKEEGKGTAPRPDEKERGASLPIFDFEYGLNPVFLEKVGSPLSQQSLFQGRGSHFWAWYIQISTMKDGSKGQKNERESGIV